MVEALTNELDKMSFRCGSIKMSYECSGPVRIILLIPNYNFQSAISHFFFNQLGFLLDLIVFQIG